MFDFIGILIVGIVIYIIFIMPKNERMDHKIKGNYKLPWMK